MSGNFQERLTEIEERIAAACARAGRDRADVQLVAVSKTHGPDAVREAVECGLSVFGESRVQEAAAKIQVCPGGLTWHLIGHLQRNKVKPAVQLFDMIHSVDSIRLLETIDAACEQAGKTMPVLLEVNVSGEASKYGLGPDEVMEVLSESTSLVHVDLIGLMTMPPFSEDPERARGFFRQLRELRDEWREQSGIPLEELSMGMTHDFEVAIEEGSTMVRIGTALFGERERREV